MLKRELSLGHGDANTLTHYALNPQTERDNPVEDVLDSIYADRKAHLRPIHDKLMTAINQFGDFELSPKKTYMSLRRKKQFAMIGPATSGRVEVGLNITGLAPHERLNEQKSGSMCNYKIKITEVAQVDDSNSQSEPVCALRHRLKPAADTKNVLKHVFCISLGIYPQTKRQNENC